LAHPVPAAAEQCDEARLSLCRDFVQWGPRPGIGAGESAARTPTVVIQRRFGGEACKGSADTSTRARVHAASSAGFSDSHPLPAPRCPPYLRHPVRPSVHARPKGWRRPKSGRPRRPEWSRNCFSKFSYFFSLAVFFLGVNQSKNLNTRRGARRSTREGLSVAIFH
jgi:hypothetical protein